MYPKTVFVQSLVRSIGLLLCFFRLNSLKRRAFPVFLGFLLLNSTVYALEYSSDNPETISAGTVISVTGGCPPYTWSFNKCGIDFSQRTTEEPQNTISAPDLSAFCGTGIITIADSCGATVSAEIRGTYKSSWLLDYNNPQESYTCIPKKTQCAHYYDSLVGNHCETTEINGGTRVYILNYDSPCHGSVSFDCPYLGGCTPEEYYNEYYGGDGTLFTYYKLVSKWVCNDPDNPSELDQDNDDVSDCKDACPNTSAFGTKYINYEGCDPIGYANVSDIELGVDSNKVNPNCGQNFIAGPATNIFNGTW